LGSFRHGQAWRRRIKSVKKGQKGLRAWNNSGELNESFNLLEIGPKGLGIFTSDLFATLGRIDAANITFRFGCIESEGLTC